MLSILCTAALGLTVLPGVEAFSSDLSWESTGQNLLPQQIEEQGTAAEQQLQQLYLQEELETYLSDKAAALGLNGLQVQIETRPDADGVFLPWACAVQADLDPWQKIALGGMLEEELGIPPERQMWNEYDLEE
ncbi:MAG: hypothetical protein J5967_00655 [Oscillospiraceae bacterium]|nr:hypothetical protein [Oscillospiraceae bacterium]